MEARSKCSSPNKVKNTKKKIKGAQQTGNVKEKHVNLCAQRHMGKQPDLCGQSWPKEK